MKGRSLEHQNLFLPNMTVHYQYYLMKDTQTLIKKEKASSLQRYFESALIFSAFKMAGVLKPQIIFPSATTKGIIFPFKISNCLRPSFDFSMSYSK